jgi:hypothetical protein
MTDRAEVALWELVMDVSPDAPAALCLLAEAIAHGCNEGDWSPENLITMIREDFDRLHIAKHLGRPN